MLFSKKKTETCEIYKGICVCPWAVKTVNQYPCEKKRKLQIEYNKHILLNKTNLHIILKDIFIDIYVYFPL